jgi:polar amino acid transport system permease protein
MHYTFRFAPVWNRFDLLLSGFETTLLLSCVAITLGFTIGVLGALGSQSRYRLVRLAIRGYVETIRNTPLLVQVFFIYFGLPGIGIRLDAITAALIALVVNLGAYATEIVRGGIEAVPKGNIEAGAALGLTRLQIFRLIVLKPALKVMFPALASQFTLLVLATSIVSQIGVTEAFHQASIIDSETYRSFEVYAVVSGCYVVVAISMRLGFAVLSQLLFGERLGTAEVAMP